MRLSLGLAILVLGLLDLRYGHSAMALRVAALAAGVLLIAAVVIDRLWPPREPTPHRDAGDTQANPAPASDAPAGDAGAPPQPERR